MEASLEVKLDYGPTRGLPSFPLLHDLALQWRFTHVPRIICSLPCDHGLLSDVLPSPTFRL